MLTVGERETVVDPPLLRSRGSRSGFTVRRLDPLDLSRGDLDRWRELCGRSLEPNPFLSPEFVLPQLECLPPSVPVVLLAVEDTASQAWRAAGVFEIDRMLPRRPLKYAQGLSSHYSYLDGILLDRERSLESLVALFEDQSRHRDWHGFHFDAIRVHSELVELLDLSAAITRVDARHSRQWARAAFDCTQPKSVEELVASCSKSRRKSLLRGRKRLESQGEISFRLVVPESGSSESVEGFLQLEHKGWKGAAGTAFRCRPDAERFFRRLADEFGPRHSMIFGELLLDGELIASTCNLRSGDVLSAFKIGWDPAYAECGLGFWSEIELASAVSSRLPGVSRIDSSSSAGSYVEEIWQGRESMCSLTYSWSTRGKVVQAAKQCCRWLNGVLRDDPRTP